MSNTVQLLLGTLLIIAGAIPLLWYLAYTLRGGRKVKKQEVIASVVISLILLFFVAYRLLHGRGMNAVSGFECYFAVLTIVEILVYLKQKREED